MSQNGKCKNSLYKEKQHLILGSAINQIEEDKSESAYVIIIGPPTGVQANEIENEDNNNQQDNYLPNEAAGELRDT